MRNGDGSAVGNLIFENGNDAAATAQHVSKTDNGKRALIFLRGFKRYHFSDTFRCAINTGRAHGFIGGD